MRISPALYLIKSKQLLDSTMSQELNQEGLSRNYSTAPLYSQFRSRAGSHAWSTTPTTQDSDKSTTSLSEAEAVTPATISGHEQIKNLPQPDQRQMEIDTLRASLASKEKELAEMTERFQNAKAEAKRDFTHGRDMDDLQLIFQRDSAKDKLAKLEADFEATKQLLALSDARVKQLEGEMNRLNTKVDHVRRASSSLSGLSLHHRASLHSMSSRKTSLTSLNPQPAETLILNPSAGLEVMQPLRSNSFPYRSSLTIDSPALLRATHFSNTLRSVVVKTHLIRCQLALGMKDISHAESMATKAARMSRGINDQALLRRVAQCQDMTLQQIRAIQRQNLLEQRASRCNTISEESASPDRPGSEDISHMPQHDLPSMQIRTETRHARPPNLSFDQDVTRDVDNLPTTSRRIPLTPETAHDQRVVNFRFPLKDPLDMLKQSPPYNSPQGLSEQWSPVVSTPLGVFDEAIVSPPGGEPGPSIHHGIEDAKSQTILTPPKQGRIHQWLKELPGGMKTSGVEKTALPRPKGERQAEKLPQKAHSC